ncbi:MAG: hypothetical protein IPP06_05450 [Saprospiraceae bacterium]|nr:hypothetical protein [Candidatus Vicinibacter affinis]
MNKFLLLLQAVCIQCISAQETIEISFEKSSDTIRRKDADFIYPLTLKIDSLNINKDSLKFYTISIKADDERSTLPKSSYSLSFNTVTLDKLTSKYTCYLTLKKDSEIDRDRLIYFSIEVLKRSQK